MLTFQKIGILIGYIEKYIVYTKHLNTFTIR